MKKFILIILLLIISNIYSQNDIKAEKILDKVSFNIDKANNFKIDFSYQIDNNIDQKKNGNIIISNDKYVLNFLGVKQICDSKFIYTIVSENKEIVVSEISKENQEIISPTNLLKFYREGYFIKIDELKRESNFTIQYIKLIPIESKSEISHLFIGINNVTNNIFKVIEIGKNKSKTILKIDNISYDLKIKKDIFVFNKDDYKDYYIEKI